MRIKRTLTRLRLFFVLVVAFAAAIVPSTEPITATPILNSVSFEAPPLNQPGPDNFVPGEILVKVKPPYSANALKRTNNSFQAQSIGRPNNTGVQRLKLPGSISVKQASEEYRKLPYVEYAEPNRIRRAQYTPNDPYYHLQWAIPHIKVPELWAQGPFNEIIVAVIDTGVDYAHPDLKNKVIKGYDFINNDPDPMDDHYHGTHVAGIVAAEANNGIGIAGIAINAKILAIKALSNKGEGTDIQIAHAIIYAADNGAKIINLSLGGPGRSHTLDNAVQYARSKGCLVIASAGNDSTSEPYYPAGYHGVIAVTATDTNNNRADFSNFGPIIDVAAPGVEILSTYNEGGPSYVYASGTSMATPVVSGVAALAASKLPNSSVEQLYRTILLSTEDLGTQGRDDYFGYGLINASKINLQQKTTVQENAKGISTTGSWQAHSSSYASDGEYLSATDAKASFSYSFSGDSICWFAKKDKSSGIAKVYIDGAYVCDVDLFSEIDKFQQPVFNKSDLQPGSHTIKIVVSGNKNKNSRGYEVNVDGFDIGAFKTVAAPQTPTGVRAVSKDSSIIVSWDTANNPNAFGYNVYRASDIAGNYVKINRVTVRSNTYKNFGVGTNATYYYRVTSVDRSGNESVPSTVASVKMKRSARR